MAEGSEQAPADWYDDPSSPGRMRYFDGQAWTNHFHEPGKLPAVGNWLGTTFSVFGQYWRDAAILAFALAFIGNAVAWVAIRATIGELSVIDDQFVNVTATTVTAGILVLLFAFAWQGFAWLAMSRYMQRAHFQAQPTVAESLRHAVRRLPRCLLFMFTLAIAALLAISLLSTIAAVAPALGAVLLLLALPVGVWVMVKLAFLVTAISVAPRETSPISASVEVSAGRFWPVLGRLLLAVVSLLIASTVVNASLGSATEFVDAQTLADSFELRNSTWEVSDLRFADLLPSAGQLVLVLLVTSVIQAASSAISTSAVVRLYLDSGGESDLGTSSDI